MIVFVGAVAVTGARVIVLVVETRPAVNVVTPLVLNSFQHPRLDIRIDEVWLTLLPAEQ